MYVEKDTDLVFEVCNQAVNYPQKTIDLFNDYMYMYSMGATHYFKHIETREYINIVATIN
jgi:hypothetical protein|tara:strand:+ start:791 stop:970 length:180 start_codon:yes stop_codon:yes gene_type:complete